MKIAHLILAHAAPAQLARLAGALDHDDAHIFVHLDRKADLKAFPFLNAGKNGSLVPARVDVGWGAYSIVEATLQGFRHIAQSDFDYVNLLSGADYPLRSAAEIHDFLAGHEGENFMEYYSVHREWTEAITRLTEYHLTNYSFPGKHAAQKWMNKLLPARTMPAGLEPVGRSQWMTLTMDAVRYILRYLEEHPEVVRFFRLTWAPDEIIFQTILYNSPFRSSLVNDNLRYIDWSKGQASPKVLTEDDLERMWASGKLFARKFDLARFPDVVDRLDARIQHPQL
ncbi:glycosyl transferase [Dyadobacter beijingensis]|uniref:Peptide O-xylosyltransferase n=1 Tax=Dyadobacter beijingensis TaxID=365489 RepID=A0ABQ2HRL9_9BACT|nr:beta-1,6-N-acetylglucosaminyltransferase [Dyadobacter beijingensis]GGM87141.1 glycosyl transferase [Dyadobacter beijingensis]